MTNNIYTQFVADKQKKQKRFAVLLDPDKNNFTHLEKTIQLSRQAKVDYFFIGGSLLVSNHLDETITTIKKNCSIPIILFPGSPMQISSQADAIFFLSLISGRNPELLIGHHVHAAPLLKSTSVEILPTGYILVNGGVPTTVSYISNTLPIPSDKDDIAACTALAGEMLGLKVIYMDAGSGAKQPISANMIQSVNSQISIPLIVGGGIKTPEKAMENCKAGADIIVVGNAIENAVSLIDEIAHAVHSSELTITQ